VAGSRWGQNVREQIKTLETKKAAKPVVLSCNRLLLCFLKSGLKLLSKLMGLKRQYST